MGSSFGNRLKQKSFSKASLTLCFGDVALLVPWDWMWRLLRNLLWEVKAVSLAPHISVQYLPWHLTPTLIFNRGMSWKATL